jgi:hypothetical protein
MSQPQPSMDALMHQLADRLDAHPPAEWHNRALVTSLLAVFDLYFDQAGTTKAPVLELVKR